MKSVKNQVCGQVRSQVWDQVWDQVSHQVWHKVSIEDQDHVRRKVWGKFRGLVESQVRDDIK